MPIILRKFIWDEEGQAMAEYGLILGFVVLAVIIMITAYGEQLALKYEDFKNEMLKYL